MAARKYNYEYGTSPKKLEPQTERRKKRPDKPKTKKPDKSSKKSSEIAKKQKLAKLEKQKKAKLITYICIGFAILLAVSYRNSQIDEQFRMVQDLKKDLVEAQKENERLQIDIENSLNFNNIEKAAIELLGMQRLNNKQRVYVELPKEDYIESQIADTTIQKEEPNGVQKILGGIQELFQ